MTSISSHFILMSFGLPLLNGNLPLPYMTIETIEPLRVSISTSQTEPSLAPSFKFYNFTFSQILHTANHKNTSAVNTYDAKGGKITLFFDFPDSPLLKP